MKRISVEYTPQLETLLVRQFGVLTLAEIHPFNLWERLDLHCWNADGGIDPDTATVAEIMASIEGVGFYVWYDAENRNLVAWLSRTEGFDESLLRIVISNVLDDVEDKDDDHYFQIKLETAFYQYHIQQYENTPLVPVARLMELVEGFSKLYPVEWTSPYERDNDEYANEIGFDSVDRYSIYQMLRKNAGMTVMRKQEIMTVFAYINQLKISPFALAITPRVIGELRQHGALKVAPHNE